MKTKTDNPSVSTPTQKVVGAIFRMIGMALFAAMGWGIPPAFRVMMPREVSGQVNLWPVIISIGIAVAIVVAFKLTFRRWPGKAEMRRPTRWSDLLYMGAFAGGFLLNLQ